MFTTTATATSTSNPTNTSQEPKLTLLSTITKKTHSPHNHKLIPMEDPRKHDKKNTRIMPISINIGPGAGIGGLVLLGGSLVTATLVSALAFNTRRESRSSPDNISKNRSPPETVLLTADASNTPESADSLPLNLQKPSDDEETIMKETQIKNIQDPTPDENHIAEQLECEEPVVMAADLESGPPSLEEDSGSEIIERSEDDGEEQKNSMPKYDNESDEHVDTKSFISDDKTVKSIQEHEAVEEGVQVEKTMALAQAIDHVGEDQETVAASVNHADVKDNSQLQNLEDEASKSEIKVSVNDDHQTTVKEDNPPTQLVNKEEEHKETEKVIKKDELIRKYEINHVESIEEEDEESSDDEGKRNSIEIEEEPTAEEKIRVLPKRRRSSVTMRLKNTWRRIRSLDIKRSEG